MESSNQSMQKKVSPGTAMLLSLFPGVGHLYLGLFNKGLLLMIAFVVSIPLSDAIGPLPAIVVFYAAFDALHLARLVNEGNKPVDLDLAAFVGGDFSGNWTTIIAGIFLISIGTMFFLRNFGIFIDLNLFWPLLLIVLGIWMIVNFFRGNGKKNDSKFK